MDEKTQPHDEYAIDSPSARLDDRTRVLKHGDTFAVSDRLGNIEAAGRNEVGVFHRDTRFLSKLVLKIGAPSGDPQHMLLLSSSIKEEDEILIVNLTNPALKHEGKPELPHGALHVFRTHVLWQASLCNRVRIRNYGGAKARFSLHLGFGADFADIFEVRGIKRRQRGQVLPSRVEADSAVLAYDGLDGCRRHTRIVFEPGPTALDGSQATYELELEPDAEATLLWTVHCESYAQGAEASPAEAGRRKGGRPLFYQEAADNAERAIRAAHAAHPVLHTPNARCRSWLHRSLADLHMLDTETRYGRYPYAGVPWYSAAFGRDGIIAALQCLWFSPDMARGVLSFLAATQADTDSAEQDAQPGKILHEARNGEMAALGEVPFGRYYGSVDSTPLFVMLAAGYHARTADLGFVKQLWPNLQRALDWIDRYGDMDGDGFVEYARRSCKGLVQQGWKDSQDSVFHEDGTLAEGPIALCEVQGYAYAAKVGAARLARLLGHTEQARELERQAARLRERFEEAFWCEDLSTYALALDGRKRPCRVRTSNAGHCLFTGIAGEERALRVAGTLLGKAGFSGWGVRTVASGEARYNPMSYHNGSVWPHDNSIIAAGLGRYGLRRHAARILDGLFEASLYFDLHRLPELFCGFAQLPGEQPTLYPQACSPQSWAAAAPLLCLQACLGLEVHGTEGKVCFNDPYLPAFLRQIRIDGLRTSQGAMDVAVTRHDRDVGVRLMRKEGDVELVVLMSQGGW